MTGPVLSSPLVSTQWLADYLGSDNLVVLDATVLPYAAPNGRPGFLSGHEQYIIEGHIPGALFADLIEEFSDTDSPLPFTHQSTEAFSATTGALGVDNETTVVVYDRSVGQWASRLWWLFRANGYDRVAVLDGGYTKWLAEGRATEVGHVEPGTAQFTATERPELWATRADVEAIVAGDAAGALVCGVPPKEFSGEEGSRARRGHIPGSINVPAARLVNRETNAVIPEAELRAAFGRHSTRSGSLRIARPGSRHPPTRSLSPCSVTATSPSMTVRCWSGVPTSDCQSLVSSSPLV